MRLEVNAHREVDVRFRMFDVQRGGLLSYSPDRLDQAGRTAGYIDRVLRGTKPGDLPVCRSDPKQTTAYLQVT